MFLLGEDGELDLRRDGRGIKSWGWGGGRGKRYRRRRRCGWVWGWGWALWMENSGGMD